MMDELNLIWILEDDSGCRFVYDEILGLRHKLVMFADVGSFVQAARTLSDGNEKPNLIIADLRLPGQSFLSFLASKEAALISALPLLVVSSVDDIDALRLCFGKGALDYITKPFGKAELVVKVERILSGKKAPVNGVSPSAIQIDSATLTVSVGERSSDQLTSKEFQIMSVLFQAPGRSCSRANIASVIWRDTKVSDTTLNVHIVNLRRKLEAVELDIQFSPPDSYSLRPLPS